MLNPIKIPANSPLPIEFLMYADLGRCPDVKVYWDKGDGTQEYLPNIHHTFVRENGVIKKTLVMADPNTEGKSLDNLIIYIK